MSPPTDVDRSATPGAPATGPSRAREQRRASRAVVLWAVYLVAIVGLSVGVGLAVPRLSTEGAGLLAWLGVLAVLTGGIAAVRSQWQLLHRTRRRWKPLTVLASVMVAFLPVWTIGQGVAASFPAHSALGARTPSDVGLPYESVTVPTSDGLALAAWWVPSKNQAAVVLMPGAGSSRTDVLDHAAVLGAYGYGVLLIDPRGHGGSGGRGMDFGWYGERDVVAGLNFLDRRPAVTDRIGVVGLSMGGEVAIGAAGVDSRVRAVVAEGATARVAADKGYLAAYGLRGDIQRGIDWATYAVAGLLSRAPEPASLRESVRDAQTGGIATPMLLITAGTVDTERLAAEYMRRAAFDAVDVWTVPEAGHTGGLRTDPAEWERRVLTFLDTNLRPAPATR